MGQTGLSSAKFMQCFLSVPKKNKHKNSCARKDNSQENSPGNPPAFLEAPVDNPQRKFSDLRGKVGLLQRSAIQHHFKGVRGKEVQRKNATLPD